MKDGTPTILYTKETRGMITLITRAWVILTLLTRERRELSRVTCVPCSRSREVTAHCHVSELYTSCGCPAANPEATASRSVTLAPLLGRNVLIAPRESS